MNCVQLLVVDRHAALEPRVGMNVEKESSGWVLGDRGVGMARRTRRTRLLQLQPTCPIGVNGRPEEITSIANFVIIESHARLVKEQIEEDAQHSS
jgi:translation initiation factor 6 (eIF-6)